VGGLCVSLDTVTTRRQFLLAAGAGTAGLAVAGGAAALGLEAHDRAEAAEVKAGREADGAAALDGAHGRLGVRRVVWSTRPLGPYAAITFDDGPTPDYTPRILAALEKAGVHATFNVMGHNAVAHPGLIRDIVAAGHELANHTMTHQDLAQIPAAQIRDEIVRCKDAVEQLVQQPLVGFRPPRGELSGYAMAVAAELGYDVFMWSRTRGPGGMSTPEIVARSIGTTVGPGDVIDLHDGIGRGTFQPTAQFARALAARREVEVRALPEALGRIADRGIVLTSATDLLARSAAEPLPTWGTPAARH
jgi:peptidoglycan/xylan/chitin deacetylase (PgdA/CDA1 family)